MNIALIGYRGTGKSATSRILGGILKRRVIHLDDEIVTSAKMTIPQIVSNKGWNYFRDLEQSLCAHFCSTDDLIIDCGGGIILRNANRRAITSNSLVFWLTASSTTIAARIGTDTNRPALVEGKTFLDEINHVLEERTPLYRECSDHIVATDTCCPTDIAQQICDIVTAHCDPQQAIPSSPSHPK